MLIPAFSSIVLDCCQHLFQGQVLPVPKTDKHNVQFIDTELSDEERTSVYVYVSVFLFEIQRQNKRDALRSHRFCFALGGSSGGNAGRRFQRSAHPGFEGRSSVCSGWGVAVLWAGGRQVTGKASVAAGPCCALHPWGLCSRGLSVLLLSQLDQQGDWHTLV